MSIINKEKMVFVTIDWMKSYEGVTKDDMPLGTGGSYPKEGKHEQYNFLEDGGKCFGYTPPNGKLNLKRICAHEIKTCQDGRQYIENVLVIFIGSKKGKRKVIGFYRDATVFNRQYESKNSKRIIPSNNNFAGYNVVVDAKNAILLNEEERTFEIPNAGNMGFGYGQHLVWYADKDDRKVVDFKDTIVKYIENIINKKSELLNEDTVAIDESIINEETYTEGGSTKSTKESYRRNHEARTKCLDFYFKHNEHYTCQICDFDFEEKYGEIGKHVIEVHHIESHAQKSKKRGVHEIDPRTDLIPVCPNCHKIIHRKEPPLEIDEVRNLIKIATA